VQAECGKEEGDTNQRDIERKRDRKKKKEW
jgi:hypothetical protein